MRGFRCRVRAGAGALALAALAVLQSGAGIRAGIGAGEVRAGEVQAGAIRTGEIRAARTLPPGTVIAAADLVLPQQAGADLRARAEALVGLETRQAVYAGRPVDRADLGPPVLVRRNSLVAMIFREGGLGIRSEGRALDSGGQGETVRVMNLVSHRTVSGEVIAAATVEVRR